MGDWFFNTSLPVSQRQRGIALQLLSARVLMRNQQSYSHFTISDLAEGLQAKRESTEPTNCFQGITVSVVDRRCGDEAFSAKEILISRVGVEYEGREDSAEQDSAWIMVKSKPQPEPQPESSPSIKLIG